MIIDFIVFSIIGIAVGCAIYVMIRNKKNGKTGCGCDCANCKRCSCNTPTKTLEREDMVK